MKNFLRFAILGAVIGSPNTSSPFAKSISTDRSKPNYKSSNKPTNSRKQVKLARKANKR